ncbi:PREDICTED: interleukin-7 isoform X1 [Condylura cristata]|uniref:interleukin-7 isoform X1 n=1 Tax=Condylura cristata TaxID=143302 RepID=UPI0006428711|nr:PREDICTED: interleukin-7 isoform X1 [Condylura cristata]
MFHVSFRYIFGIPPLILVLLPVASSDCEIDGKEGKEYENVLMISINYLEAMFLNRAARKLKQLPKIHDSEDFNLHLSRVSQGTLKLLNCTKVKGKKLPSLGEAQSTKNLEENKYLKEKNKQKCFLKTLLQKIKTCWNKILRGH